MKNFDERFTFEYNFIDYDDEVSDDHSMHMTFISSKNDSYTNVVDKFLAFLSSAYGYPITLDRLAEERFYREGFGFGGTED